MHIVLCIWHASFPLLGLQKKAPHSNFSAFSTFTPSYLRPSLTSLSLTTSLISMWTTGYLKLWGTSKALTILSMISSFLYWRLQFDIRYPWIVLKTLSTIGGGMGTWGIRLGWLWCNERDVLIVGTGSFSRLERNPGQLLGIRKDDPS